ncbi:MAG: TRAP transporter substrate-binding protein DctP [Deltaproteobacteria bacterium]|nr:TRAP transporter substrate-binding protein DctP [Deltaproteobacteria bacterium]
MSARLAAALVLWVAATPWSSLRAAEPEPPLPAPESPPPEAPDPGETSPTPEPDAPPSERSEGPTATGAVAPTAPSERPVALRIKTVAPRGSPWGELLTNLSTRLKKVTDGKVVVTHFWEQKSEAALVRQCQRGKTDGIAVSLGALAAIVPELDAAELPYLFDDYAAADRAFARATPLIAELLATEGFVLALRGENGFRHFATVGEPVTSPESLRGRVVRSQPGPVHEAMWRALGAEPKALQVADVPASLVGGVVTGYDNTLAFARLLGWSDAISHVTLSAHVYQAAVVVWCPTWFSALPDELKPLVSARDPKLEASGLKLVRVFNDKLMPEQYAALGKGLRALTREERAAFRAALVGVVEAFRTTTSDRGRALLEALERR